MMTPWPNSLNAVPVSTTINPVTHTALVAVNAASRMPTRSLPCEMGSASSTVPATISPRNDSAMIWDGDDGPPMTLERLMDGSRPQTDRVARLSAGVRPRSSRGPFRPPPCQSLMRGRVRSACDA